VFENYRLSFLLFAHYLFTIIYCCCWCLLELHCGGGFYVRSLVRDLGIGKNIVGVFCFVNTIVSLNIFYSLVKYLLRHYINHNQTLFYLDVSMSISDLRQEKLLYMLLPVLATVMIDSYIINWSECTILDRESGRVTRWIKESVHICKEGRRSMNWDEGSYTWSH